MRAKEEEEERQRAQNAAYEGMPGGMPGGFTPSGSSDDSKPSSSGPKIEDVD